MNLISIARVGALAAVLPALAAEPSQVIIRGEHQPQMGGTLWSLREKGAWTRLGYGTSFKVPGTRRLVITEMAFTLVTSHGPATGANFRLSAKEGPEYRELAVVTARVQRRLRANTVVRTFTPGLQVEAGTELKAGLAELSAPDRSALLDVMLYGYLE